MLSKRFTSGCGGRGRRDLMLPLQNSPELDPVHEGDIVKRREAAGKKID